MRQGNAQSRAPAYPVGVAALMRPNGAGVGPFLVVGVLALISVRIRSRALELQ
ncbi:MAG: hypothetical protein JSW46_17650 [Gemmatimonadota bacterium]|nr:MAG: hypothetical protein JSW46_17650 [Gemmatimonadota bacterium]